MTKFSYKISFLFDIFSLEVNFDKSTSGLHLHHTCKISRKLKINSYVIIKLFKL